MADKKIERHTREAMSWETEMNLLYRKQRNAAWWVAGAFGLLALGSVAAVAMLAPLKATVPYIVQVDKATGEAQVLDAFGPGQVSLDELNHKHWVSRYVTQRESYFYWQLQSDYDSVFYMSGPGVRQVYTDQYTGDNNREKRLGANTEERVVIKSVTLHPVDFTGNNLDRATVRFEKQRRSGQETRFQPTGTYVATLAYKWEPNRRGRERELVLNPLGFMVVQYRVDEEFGGNG
jgi:type IV secretion system protein VirB8